MPPITRALESEPIKIAHWFSRGVPPTRKPVLSDWAVVPPLDEATQTTPATDNANTRIADDSQPRARKIRQVSVSVATVMPEIGLDEEPISPVSREETVTNNSPKSTTRAAPATPLFHPTSAVRNTASTAIKARLPSSTVRVDMSSSVRCCRRARAPRPCRGRHARHPERIDRRIIGSVRNMLMIPAVATQPAPMNRQIIVAQLARAHLADQLPAGRHRFGR